MKRSLLAVATAAAVLAVVPGAGAKAPPNGIDVCGSSACVHLDWAHAEPFWIGERWGVRTPAASSFYVLRWHWGPTAPGQTSYYVPAARVVRWSSENGGAPNWTTVSDAASQTLDRAAEGLEPYAVPSPTEVTVAGKRAQAPETYLRLYRGAGAGFPPVVRWLKVTIRSETPSPWTDGLDDLQISARGRLVWTHGWVHRISLRLANRARRGLPLSP